MAGEVGSAELLLLPLIALVLFGPNAGPIRRRRLQPTRGQGRARGSALVALDEHEPLTSIKDDL